MKISASCRFDREWLEMFKRVGFEAVMLSLGPYFGEKSEKFPIYVDRDNPEIPESELKEYFTEWKDIIADIGLEIDQTHGVFSGHASAGNTFNYDVHLLRMIYSVKATHYLGIKKCVLHPIMIPERYNEHYKKEVFEKNIEFFKRLRPYLEEYDVYACIENMFRGDPVYRHICPTTCSRADEMCALVDALGNDRFKLCLDIGHAALTQQDPTKMVYEMGDRLVCTHGQDNDGIEDLHTRPFCAQAVPAGCGFEPVRTDWHSFMCALADVGYEGNINFEAGPAAPVAIREGGYRYMAALEKYLVSVFDKRKAEISK